MDWNQHHGNFMKTMHLLLGRVYLFYKNVIKERDDFMLFYYTVFAFSMFIVFYSWSIIICLRIFGIFELGLTFGIQIGLLAIILLPTMYYFFKNRDFYVSIMEEHGKTKFSWFDIVILFYILLSFSFMFLE